jgi:hypothetical protein
MEDMMMYRALPVVLAVLALLLFLSPAAFAEDKVHEGKVVKAGDGQLTMTDKDGTNKHTHKVPASAIIKCDGKECKLEDLKEGYFVKVTTGEDERTAKKIEARTKEREEK